MQDSVGLYEADNYSFEELKTSEHIEQYEILLKRSYKREGIYSESFLPCNNTVKYGIFFKHDTLVAICGLKTVGVERLPVFKDHIQPSIKLNENLIEIVNVVVEKSHYGTLAFPILCFGVGEAAISRSADILVGITRASLLKSFVQFGLFPAVHPPLHVLGNDKINDFIIFYDFRRPNATDYMRLRGAHIVEQSQRMSLIRSQYLESLRT
jgi:hypothetical protein